LLPDGDLELVVARGAPVDKAAGGVAVAGTWEASTEKVECVSEVLDIATPGMPKGLAPLYCFSFFYAMMFGGCDFDMIGMVNEAGGQDNGVDVAMHIFIPLAIASAVGTPIVGEIMDRCGAGVSLTIFLLGCCGLLTFVVTNLLRYAGTTWAAILYGILRGLTNCVYGPLLSDGLAFAAFGVDRSIIGHALGNNRLFALAGTGAGPLLYGVSKDMTGSFALSLQLTSLPPLALALYFWSRGFVRCLTTRALAAKGYTKTECGMRGEVTKSDTHVIGKALSETTFDLHSGEKMIEVVCTYEMGSMQSDFTPEDAIGAKQ
jgi:hypothetical protein